MKALLTAKDEEEYNILKEYINYNFVNFYSPKIQLLYSTMVKKLKLFKLVLRKYKYFEVLMKNKRISSKIFLTEEFSQKSFKLSTNELLYMS